MTGARILILGGIAEARQIATTLAGRGAAVTLSLAGVTRTPRDQGVPTRVGGFGGVDGLADHLRRNGVDLLIDATHPYAARISANAASAARKANTPIVAYHRPPWVPRDSDDWQTVPDLAAALDALGPSPKRLFVALGRKEIAALSEAPRHSYLIRSVDPIDGESAPPDRHEILGRGPFKVEEEIELLKQHRIEAIICKNSGGTAASAKLDAARRLGLLVTMLARPELPDVPNAATPEMVVELAARAAGLVTPR